MRYAAFLRAVNLGRNRRVSGAELCAIFEELGLEQVSAFQTSGNVVFEAPRDATAQIEKALERALGYEVAIFLRTQAQVRKIAAEQPFSAKQVEGSKGKLQVLLLSAKPTTATRKKVLALATQEDLLEFGERELYWLPSGGTMESTLDTKAIGKLLGPTTQRTKGTIERLAAKFFA